MATPLKIDPQELDRLLGEGKKVKEIAEHFSCTTGAVSQAKRRLGVAVAAALREAPVIVEKRGRAMEILAELANRVHRELTWIETTIPPSRNEDYREWQEQKLRHVAEIRKIVTAMADAGVKIYQVEVVEKALRIMLQEISNESPECQKRIRDRFERASINLELDDGAA